MKRILFLLTMIFVSRYAESQVVARFVDVVSDMQSSAVSDSIAEARFADFLRGIGSNREVRDSVSHAAEELLFTQDSPYDSDRMYLAYLRSALSDPGTDDVDSLRINWSIENVSRNLTGTQFADFQVVDEFGTAKSVSALMDGAEYALIIFYDPDCDHCIDTLCRLASDTRYADMAADGRLCVISVDTSVAGDLPHERSVYVPSFVIDSHAVEDVVESNAVSIRDFPAVFLVSGGVVMMRERPLHDVGALIS